MASPNTPPTQTIEGYKFPAMFPTDIIKSAIDYKPDDDDIFIVTYPKCGTTWSHHTLALILRHGEPFGDDFKVMASGRFIEMAGVNGMDKMPRPHTFKTHLPFRLTPWSDKAKYIYVTRNPKDTCVSFFHHMKNMPVHAHRGDFDEFFENFLSGDIGYGDYFDHLDGWYEQRNLPNVLFVTYEEMKENPKAAILKIASFVDDEKYAEPLRQDRQKLDNVLKYSSFKEMKVTINKSMDRIFLDQSSKEMEESDMPESIKEMISKLHENKEENESTGSKSLNFVRKGIIGDWRNHFSEDQSRRMDEKFAKRTKDMEIAEIWKKYM